MPSPPPLHPATRPAFLQPAPVTRRRLSITTLPRPALCRSHPPPPRPPGKRARRAAPRAHAVQPPPATPDASPLAAHPQSLPSNPAFAFSQPQFAHAAEGEWFGYECTFSLPDGTPQNIPDYYIPDEYREWGVDIPGFDTLTSTKCLANGDLLVKRTRALPSVGCEADAVVPEVSERTLAACDDCAVNGGFADGSMSCGPARMEEGSVAPFSFTLAHPTSRLRVRVEFCAGDAPTGELTMYVEKWDAEFCGGAILPGCGGAGQSFAGDAVLQPEKELTGTWEVRGVEYGFGEGEGEPQERSYVLERTAATGRGEVTVALPKGVSVGFTTGEDGERLVATAWLVDEGTRVVTRRVYGREGKLKSVMRAVETRTG